MLIKLNTVEGKTIKKGSKRVGIKDFGRSSNTKFF
jgi:hypothetical protein